MEFSMKQDQEERTIRELFQQLRRDDESGAPSFVDSLAPASFRHERDSRLRLGWQVAGAIVVALLLGGAWLIFSGRDTKTPAHSNAVNSNSAPAPRDESPLPNPTPSPIGGKTIKPDHQHRQQRRAQRRPETLLLSQWRSPTEFLMRAPGEQLLKTIPRLNESLIEIKLVAPTQQNNKQN
jgi:hypothetical protein